MIVFNEDNHRYSDMNGITMTSVTSFIGKYKQKFDAEAVAAKVSKNKKSKWYGKTPEQILEFWQKESERSTTLGSWYHKLMENDILSCSSADYSTSASLPVVKPTYDRNGDKILPNQKLEPGIYPEHMMYLKSVGLCGQSDLVIVDKDNKVFVSDYKTNKSIDTASYVDYRGVSKKMLPPIQHLDDCNFNHYALQLSFYMYIILRHNPHLEFGGLKIEHITFEKEAEDENGFPIYKQTPQGDFIVEKVSIYDVPYLEQEIASLLDYETF